MNALLLMFLACGEKDATEETTTEDTETTETEGVALSDFIYVTEAATGDDSCFAGESGVLGYEIASSSWNAQDVATSSVTTISLDAEVIDFESDDPVEEAFVDIFWSNTVSGTSDSSDVSAEDGSASIEVEACSPFSYRVYTDPALEETKVTIEANTVEKPTSTATELNSVSSATYRVITALMGISPDDDKGLVAGTMYDCNEEAIEGAQVVVRDVDGNIPESLVVKYFVDDFPNRTQEWTSADGLWLAVNVPAGTWFVDAYVSDGAGGHTVKGSTAIEVSADSINISNIHTGFGDGIKYPESCLVSE
jgi:hypothetical protein